MPVKKRRSEAGATLDDFAVVCIVTDLNPGSGDAMTNVEREEPSIGEDITPEETLEGDWGRLLEAVATRVKVGTSPTGTDSGGSSSSPGFGRRGGRRCLQNVSTTPVDSRGVGKTPEEDSNAETGRGSNP
jgi:hypothetical protein